MRWIMIALTIIGFVLAIVAKSAGVLAIGVLLLVVGLFGAVFSLAADRVAASSRPESAMLSVEDLAAMRKARTPQAHAPKGPPPTS